MPSSTPDVGVQRQTVFKQMDTINQKNFLNPHSWGSACFQIRLCLVFLEMDSHGRGRLSAHIPSCPLNKRHPPSFFFSPPAHSPGSQTKSFSLSHSEGGNWRSRPSGEGFLACCVQGGWRWSWVQGLRSTRKEQPLTLRIASELTYIGVRQPHDLVLVFSVVW